MRTLWLLLSLSPMAAATPLLRNEGIATTAQGAVSYREVHWQRSSDEGAQRWVQYLCPDGRPFARKQMPASAQPTARGYQLQDQRSGQAAQVRIADGWAWIDWKEDAAAPRRNGSVALPADAVVDAGFDAAVRQHWQALMRGEPLSLPFLVPSRQRFYPVKVMHRGAVRWQGIAAQSIEVRLDAWYGGMAPRLALVYADSDRRLLQFQGTSNLRDARGDYPTVTVRFSEPASPRSLEQWQQAWSQPLVASCSVTRE